MTMPGGQEGTVFKSLTVEGEDRIHLEFDRPELRLELDPTTAPGLDLGSARDVLDRTVPDRMTPLTAMSAREACPQVGHPWLRRFATGAVARFKPDVEGVQRWKLTVANAKGEAVATFQGRGEPPREIVWDGRSQTGAPVVPGLTYSYVLEAHDRAGNKRNFVGEGFQVSAYRLDGPEGPTMAFSASEMGTTPTHAGPGSAAVQPASPIVIEAATWLNQAPVAQRPIRVTVTARSFERADQLARTIAQQLAPHLIGDPSRIQAQAEVQADAPEVATVRIAAAK